MMPKLTASGHESNKLYKIRESTRKYEKEH